MMRPEWRLLLAAAQPSGQDVGLAAHDSDFHITQA
jgi:hypothetical protein